MDWAINRKTRKTRVPFHDDSNSVRIRHVDSGTLPYVRITSLTKVVYMATNAISDMLRQMESPTRSRRKVLAKGPVAILKESIQLGWVSQDSYPRKSLLRQSENLGSKRAVKFSEGTWHLTKIRERKGPSRGLIQKCAPHGRSPCALKFKNRSHEETLQQERCARKAAWNLANIFLSSRIRIQIRFIFLVKPITSKRPEEREFVVDSGAWMHMMSKKELSSEEIWTVKRSRNPTVVLTADWEVHTHEEAQVFVHDLDQFVTVQLLEETFAVLSLGKLCKDHGCSYEWVSGQEPRLTNNGKSIICKTNNFVPFVVPGLSVNSGSSSSSTAPPQKSLGPDAHQVYGNRAASSSSSGSVLE